MSNSTKVSEKKTFIVTYIVPKEEYNEETFTLITCEDNPEAILKAMRADGLSWEIEKEECRVAELRYTGKELLESFNCTNCEFYLNCIVWSTGDYDTPRHKREVLMTPENWERLKRFKDGKNTFQLRGGAIDSAGYMTCTCAIGAELPTGPIAEIPCLIKTDSKYYDRPMEEILNLKKVAVELSNFPSYTPPEKFVCGRWTRKMDAGRKALCGVCGEPVPHAYYDVTGQLQVEEGTYALCYESNIAYHYGPEKDCWAVKTGTRSPWAK